MIDQLLTAALILGKLRTWGKIAVRKTLGLKTRQLDKSGGAQQSWSLLSSPTIPYSGKHPPNFAEKTFANIYKTSKFAKVLSLKSFPVWFIIMVLYQSCCPLCASVNRMWLYQISVSICCDVLPVTTLHMLSTLFPHCTNSPLHSRLL